MRGLTKLLTNEFLFATNKKRGGTRSNPTPTVRREQAFAAGRSVSAVAALADEGAGAPTVVNTLANFVRAGLAAQGDAARLLSGVAELWQAL